MGIKYGELVTSTQAKIESDVDFQNTLIDLSDDDKAIAVSAKQEELINAELEAIEQKATKAEEIAKNQKIRAEKAEAEAKKPKVAAPKTEGVTVQDVVALRDVHEADVNWLVEEAKLRGKSVLEMKADPYTQIILKTRAEERKTADATSTSSSRKSQVKTGDLLKKAEKGELAEDEMAEAAKLSVANMFGK